MRRKALIVFMRYPREGEVKSRLAACVGGREAARIYEKLVRRTLGLVSEFIGNGKRCVDAFIAFSPAGDKERIKDAFPGPWRFFAQDESAPHLGGRMEKAFLHVRSLGYESIVLTGSDLADTKVCDFRKAFDFLENGGGRCAVLGPATDGGFYLIGLNRPCPLPFSPEQWGEGEICLRTERLICDSGMRVQRLEARTDIDRPGDLAFLESLPAFKSTLSVIVPTLSGPEGLEPFLSSIEPALWPGDEIVVVQGGECREETGDTENFSGRVRWLCSARGRGVQLNHGARAARGDIFLFLHGDSLPPAHFAYCVRKIREAPETSLGCFGLGFLPSTPLLKIISAGANLRTRLLKMPFGDQGLFCRRETFEKIGGFKRLYLMEDVEFVRECRKLGGLVILPETVLTSPRRYLGRGIVRAFLQNQLVMLLYRLGANERFLYSLYYGK